MATQTNDKTFSTVPLDWKEVYYTNCPIVSAGNVSQELGWTREEFVPAHPCARGHPQDQAPEEEQGGSFWDVEL